MSCKKETSAFIHNEGNKYTLLPEPKQCLITVRNLIVEIYQEGGAVVVSLFREGQDPMGEPLTSTYALTDTDLDPCSECGGPRAQKCLGGRLICLNCDHENEKEDPCQD